MSKELKPFLALAVLVFVSGVAIFSNGPSGNLLSTGGGGGGGADITKPTISLSISPTTATTSTTVTLTATAYDNSALSKIDIYADGVLVKTCAIYNLPTSGVCALAKIFSAGSHSFSARATDFAGNMGVSTTQSLSVAGSTATKYPVTISKTQYGSYASSISIDLGQDIQNVVKISFTGVPGGELCGAAITLTALNSQGYAVASATTGRVNTHQAASGSLTLNNVKVMKIVGTPTADSAWWTSDCTHIDSLQASVSVSDDRNGPTIYNVAVPDPLTGANLVIEQANRGGGYASCIARSYTVHADVYDPSYVSKTTFTLGSNVIAPTCTPSATETGASSCTYTGYDIKPLKDAPTGETKTLRIDSSDSTPYKNQNYYQGSFKIPPQSYAC